MKKFYLISLSLIFMGGINAQSILDTNNARVFLSDNGNMFSSGGFLPGYEIPKGSGLHTIYSAAMWYGGVDANGQLNMATNSLGTNSQDVWPGPLTFGTANPLPVGAWTQTMWTVSKAEIEQHVLNFQNPGYIVPADIASWPAHGDVALGFDFYLAPFVDLNNDGNYNALDGDYPCIKGDKATFFIMNDKANNHGSGTVPIGLELHYMFYQYNQQGDIGNTTFMDVKMINRGVQTLYDFHIGLIMDGDLGNSQDDYVGCDSLRNLQYYYNDTNDEQGYGLNPPSFGVACLTDNLTSAVSLSGQNGFPISGVGSYNVMKGLNPNGTGRYAPFSSLPTTFEYFDSPSSSGWSEIGAGNMNGERRTSMGVNIGTLTPAMEKKMTYAVVYNRSGNDNIENVDELLITTDLVQNFHDISTDGNCSQSIFGLNESMLESIDFKIFPNPTSKDFVLELSEQSSFVYTISDMSGRELLAGTSNNSKANISLNAPAGVYIIKVTSEKGSQAKRIFIK